jgi:hypothetical protein
LIRLRKKLLGVGGTKGFTWFGLWFDGLLWLRVEKNNARLSSNNVPVSVDWTR